MPLISDQQILRLQFPINNPKFMQDSHPNNNLRDDVLNDSLTENYVLALEVEVEVTHGGVVHDDVDVDLVLEGLFYVY